MYISTIEGRLKNGQWVTVADANMPINDQKELLKKVILADGVVHTGKTKLNLVYVHRRDGQGIRDRKQFTGTTVFEHTYIPPKPLAKGAVPPEVPAVDAGPEVEGNAETPEV